MTLIYLLGILPAFLVFFFVSVIAGTLGHTNGKKLLIGNILLALLWPAALIFIAAMIPTYILTPIIEEWYYKLRLGKELYRQMENKMAIDYMRMDELDHEIMLGDNLTDCELDKLEIELNELTNKTSGDYFKEFKSKKNVK